MDFFYLFDIINLARFFDMDNKNKNNNKNKKKLPFGRNLFTLIFITVSVVVLAFVISTITSYVTASNKSKYTPFETKAIPYLEFNYRKFGI